MLSQHLSAFRAYTSDTAIAAPQSEQRSGLAAVSVAAAGKES
jgi:hypothetical protein